MAIPSNVEVCDPARKQRTKCPGVRVIRGIIYDSENGKTCHQCRQKTRVFSAACKNQKGLKQCTISFCQKCLLNRYGEKAEDVALLDDWICPKCKGICNCSQCMKKRGHKPTGQLAHTAKATGFSSVSEMLRIKGNESSCDEKKIAEETVVLLKEPLSPKKASIADSFRKSGKENSFDGNCDSDFKSLNLTPKLNERNSKKKKREGLKELCNSVGDVDISLKNKSPKEPKISEEIAKKKKLQISEDIKSNVSEGIIRKEVISNEQDGHDFVEKKKSKSRKTKVSKKDSSNLIKQEGKQDAHFDNAIDPKDIENSTAAQLKGVSESCKARKNPAELPNKEFAADIQLPQGANLTTIAGTETRPEDVGHALQFLEFCTAFGEVLDLKKGQAEYIIREIIRGRIRRRGHFCPIVQIHIKLLSLIQEDRGEESPSLISTSGKNSWLQALRKCVSESKCPLNDIPFDCFEGDGFDVLDCSKKLKLLNFLCDEALNTTVLRSWIDDQNSKYIEEEKQAKAKVAAANDKVKEVREKMQKEWSTLKDAAPSSIAEHEAIISKLKDEESQALSEKLEANGMESKKRKRSDAVRTESILLEENGHAFWRLKGYSGKPDILLQDLQGNWDVAALDEKWLVYDADQKPAIEKYISLRTKKPKAKKAKKPLVAEC